MGPLSAVKGPLSNIRVSECSPTHRNAGGQDPAGAPIPGHGSRSAQHSRRFRLHTVRPQRDGTAGVARRPEAVNCFDFPFSAAPACAIPAAGSAAGKGHAASYP
jgi:hypothetical protein